MSAQTVEERFASAMGQLLGPDFPDTIALAVSGGGDSMAMLALAQNWARDWGVTLSVVTVDHGLRAESATEAAMIAQFCAEIGRSHTILKWNWDKAGNVQDAARRARLSLIDAWRGDIAHVLMGHTADDQAETFLMRLARGSGVDGLSAMSTKRVAPQPAGQAMTIIRPCLEISRAELRHYAKTLHVPWVDDPTNDDTSFERVRMRQAADMLADLGLTRDTLTATATRLARAGQALRARALDVVRDIVVSDAAGVLVLDATGLANTERDTQMRLVSAAVCWISGADYRPRAAALEDVLDRVLSGGAGTLSGCQLDSTGAQIRIFRELQAARDVHATAGELWDGRWEITGPAAAFEVSALGEDIFACPDWRASRLPRNAVMASPAIWQNGTLLAAPVAGFGPSWTAEIATDYRTYLESH